MARFLPHDSQKAEALTASLEQSIFKNIDSFITLYNSGYVNRKNEEIQKIAKEITATYKDVKDAGGQLVFISTEEIRLEELASLIEEWAFIVKVKRELESLTAAGDLTREDLVVFTVKAVGYLHRVEDPDGNLTRLSQERVCSKNAVVASVYQRYSRSQEESSPEKGFYAFMVDDFLQRDASFVEAMVAAAPR